MPASNSGLGLYHAHKRKRIHEKFEEYPHSDKLKNLFDRIMVVVGLFGPLVTIPQIIEIWVYHNAAGVSPISWAGYLLIALFWVFYGVLHREKPVIIVYLIWIIFDLLIVVGIFMHA